MSRWVEIPGCRFRYRINDENLAQRVLAGGDVQWCLSELSDILEADIEAVTRCKDCKFNSGAKKCLNPNSFIAVPADDDYCSYGEKRV